MRSSGVIKLFIWLVSVISLSTAAEVNITVSKAPRLIDSIDKLNHPEDTNATLSCSIGSGDLDGLVYEWYKDEKKINPATNPSKFRIIQTESIQSMLRLFNLKPADSGSYSCLARNGYGQDKITIRLFVKVQLKWIVEPENVEVGAGKFLEIPCKADGSPSPTIQWTRLDGPDANRHLGSELKLLSVSPADSGVYECRARNGMEPDLVSKIRLNVLGK